MRTYKLSSDYIRQTCRRMNLFLSSSVTAIVIFSVIRNYTKLVEKTIWPSIFTALFALFSSAIILYWNSRKYAAQLRSYKILIDDLNITRSQRDFDDLTIPLQSIQTVRVHEKWGTLIQGENAFSALRIPSGLENMPDLVEFLAQYQPIQPLQSSWRNLVQPLAITAVLIVGFVMQLRTMNLPITIFGTIVYGVLAVILGVISWREPNQEKSSKFYSVGIVLFIWSILAMKLFFLLSYEGK